MYVSMVGCGGRVGLLICLNIYPGRTPTVYTSDYPSWHIATATVRISSFYIYNFVESGILSKCTNLFLVLVVVLL